MILDADGWAVDGRIEKKPFPGLNHGRMEIIDGIVVHQTGAKTIMSTFNSYGFGKGDTKGAHFLIDKDGKIYQTASTSWLLWHVGQLKARCAIEYKCSPVEAKLVLGFKHADINRLEKGKSFPDRFPENKDSIGIELVGAPLDQSDDAPYETVTDQQNKSLSWLVSELRLKFEVPLQEVYRHPQLSYKNPHEAETAKW
ncbi:MAG: peptidoglycan recognition family protein [Azospirillaceae bacterium]|nr:peptidoglycan recognition family protein [Azospirillaceae bacterium]